MNAPRFGSVAPPGLSTPEDTSLTITAADLTTRVGIIADDSMTRALARLSTDHRAVVVGRGTLMVNIQTRPRPIQPELVNRGLGQDQGQAGRAQRFHDLSASTDSHAGHEH